MLLRTKSFCIAHESVFCYPIPGSSRTFPPVDGTILTGRACRATFLILDAYVVKSALVESISLSSDAFVWLIQAIMSGNEASDDRLPEISKPDDGLL